MKPIKVSSLLFLVSCIFLLASCAHKPTKIYSTQDIDLQVLNQATLEPIKITEETVILDARPPFEFAMSHHPQAVNIQWSDFADVRGPYPGLLLEDLDGAVRRLALIGITPNTQVLVVGGGINGKGEDGRLAWTLFYLGLNRVQVADAMKTLRFSNLVPPPRPNATPWDPVLRSSIIVSRADMVRAAASKQKENVHILDVRTKEEFFSKDRQLEYETPDLRAVHIVWREFFTANGRPNPAIVNQLKAININLNDRVIVISNNGVRSGAVTFALLALGYKNAGNYAGGYSELLRRKQNQ